jgi:cation diffusion facilitator family transporter
MRSSQNINGVLADKRQLSATMVYAAMGSDLLIAIVKFAAAWHTGSSAMLSEGVHSTVDALTELLLLYGLRVARLPATSIHQLGFGREIFFWNFVVAMTILAVGAGVAFLDGMHQIMAPRPISSPLVSYGVLAFAIVAEAGALVLAVREAVRAKGRRRFFAYLLGSRDATSLTVLFSGSTGIIGLLVAAAGTYASTELGRPECDGVASIVIGAILTVTALFLARTSKTLLIGVPASPETVRSILDVVATHPAVACANGAITVHLAPDQILLALSVSFQPTCNTAKIEQAIATIDDQVRKAHPQVVAFSLKPESPQSYLGVRRTRGW